VQAGIVSLKSETLRQRDADRERVRYGPSSNDTDEGIPVGDNRQTHGVQARHRAAKTWRRLKGENQLPKVVQGVRFQNGIEIIEMPVHHDAA
jgi:hypothetical protein